MSPHLSPDADKSTPMAFPTDNARTTQYPKMGGTKAVSPPGSFLRDPVARREMPPWHLQMLPRAVLVSKALCRDNFGGCGRSS